MSDGRIIRTLRQQAWERAKGELESVLSTYWDDDGFDEANEKIQSFILDIEVNGVVE
ncbi:MAG: hypothetical protein R3230_00025 [Nitrosopumilaceae archaeon]|nr:hypothetical protein [Nitrosopumilaceae archaeon]